MKMVCACVPYASKASGIVESMKGPFCRTCSLDGPNGEKHCVGAGSVKRAPLGVTGIVPRERKKHTLDPCSSTQLLRTQRATWQRRTKSGSSSGPKRVDAHRHAPNLSANCRAPSSPSALAGTFRTHSAADLCSQLVLGHAAVPPPPSLLLPKTRAASDAEVDTDAEERVHALSWSPCCPLSSVDGTQCSRVTAGGSAKGFSHVTR